jgi:SAM-dependent methyltransferase
VAFEARENHIPQGWGVKALIIRLINFFAVLLGRGEAMLSFSLKTPTRKALTMKRQISDNQKGEIEFRKKLYSQQIENKTIFEDEFDAAGIEKILKVRMEKTRNQMTLLQSKNISLSPYIEIGAERCQRSLVMENDLGLNGGAALDISFDMLKSCNHYQDVFNKPKSPIRICCDANKLPFITGSIPFVFCYETLHHFPEPTPITKEIFRVMLPGGFFFFDEEPYKQVLRLKLYKGRKIYSKKSLDRSIIKKAIDRFFCDRSCNEVDHGIIENDNLSLKLWKQALAPFDEKEIMLSSTTFFQSDLFHPNSKLTYLAAYLLGGNISGVCRKAGLHKDKNRTIFNTLICPSCRELGNEVLLMQENLSFFCPNCSKKYPNIDNVLFLFSYDKFEELYPDIFHSFQKK